MTQHAAGMFCWSQLGTRDPEGAKKFYAPLFGWTYEDTTIDGNKFTLVKKGGKTIGGLYGLMKEQIDRSVPANWEAYIMGAWPCARIQPPPRSRCGSRRSRSARR